MENRTELQKEFESPQLSGQVGNNKRNGYWYVWTNEGAYLLNLSNLRTLHEMFPGGWDKRKINFYLTDKDLIINK